MRVACDAHRLVPVELALPRFDDPRADGCRRLALVRTEQLMLREPRDRQPQVDPVEQRAGELRAIPAEMIVAAGAVAHGIAAEPTRARVCRGDESEPRESEPRGERNG